MPLVVQCAKLHAKVHAGLHTVLESSTSIILFPACHILCHVELYERKTQLAHVQVLSAYVHHEAR